MPALFQITRIAKRQTGAKAARKSLFPKCSERCDEHPYCDFNSPMVKWVISKEGPNTIITAGWLSPRLLHRLWFLTRVSPACRETGAAVLTVSAAEGEQPQILTAALKGRNFSTSTLPPRAEKTYGSCASFREQGLQGRPGFKQLVHEAEYADAEEHCCRIAVAGSFPAVRQIPSGWKQWW